MQPCCMTGELLRSGKLYMDRCTGRRPCEDEGGDQRDAAGARGKPKSIGKQPEPRGARNRFYFTALRSNQPCRQLNLKLLASRTVRK